MNTNLNVSVICLVFMACQACAPMPAGKKAEPGMPDNFLELVDYVDASTVREWQEQGMDVVILDVRTEKEFVEDGYAPGAVLQSYYLGKKRRHENAGFLDAVADRYDAGQKLLIMCSHGMRATQAAWELKEKKGFTDVHVFPGGYEGHHMAGYGGGDGWKADGLPLVFTVDGVGEKQEPN